jgi:hypothetical protein
MGFGNLTLRKIGNKWHCNDERIGRERALEIMKKFFEDCVFNYDENICEINGKPIDRKDLEDYMK